MVRSGVVTLLLVGLLVTQASPAEPGRHPNVFPDTEIPFSKEYIPRALINSLRKVYIDRKRRKGIGLEVAVRHTYEAIEACYQKTKPEHLWDIQLTPNERRKMHQQLEWCLRQAASRIPQKMLSRLYPEDQFRACAKSRSKTK